MENNWKSLATWTFLHHVVFDIDVILQLHLETKVSQSVEIENIYLGGYKTTKVWLMATREKSLTSLSLTIHFTIYS